MKKIIALITLGMIFITSMLFAKEVTISVGAGECWKQKSEPQFSVWLEDENGNFIRTLYVTQRASKKNWRMSPKEGRPESLPVWYHKSKNKAAKTENELDAVTSATPKGGIIFNADIGEAACRICAEFNTSFDYNENYTKKNSGVNGQPSIVYIADISSDFSEGEILLQLSGTGAIDGSDGNIYPVPVELTTARRIVKAVAVKAN
ncbi:DUF2271 domain-containing protein [Treponema bryantii]|uniref:DUF2271 domain-containing protein n=1 Tax=Treponema bryantii TaxID=163 RepID=UPI002B2D1D88|nr:hypothetical protein TRBR_26210 [Treponema bryantii]